eukprot:757493-Prorocentrum_minimum.AAC.1
MATVWAWGLSETEGWCMRQPYDVTVGCASVILGMSVRHMMYGKPNLANVLTTLMVGDGEVVY